VVSINKIWQCKSVQYILYVNKKVLHFRGKKTQYVPCLQVSPRFKNFKAISRFFFFNFVINQLEKRNFEFVFAL